MFTIGCLEGSEIELCYSCNPHWFWEIILESDFILRELLLNGGYIWIFDSTFGKV